MNAQKMKMIFCAVFFLLMLSLPVVPAVHAKTAKDVSINLPAETQKKILSNGLTVLITEMPSSPQVSIYVLVKTGAATEGPYLGAGISHFLEHMMFKGTEKRKTGEIAGEVQRLGGVINASTGYDQTVYTLTLPAEKFDQGLDIMADMMQHPRFDPQEFEKEREVILREVRLHNDNPDSYLGQLIFEHAYRVHPYHVPVIGYENLFRHVKREELMAYYQEKYAPNNMVLAIAGRVKAQDIFPSVEAAFKDFPRQRFIPRNLPAEPLTFSAQRYEEEYPTELTRLSMAYKGVSVTSKDMVPLDILARILGQGESSRLYQELFAKQKLVYSISASNYTPIDPGIFDVAAELDNARVDQTIVGVKAEIRHIQEKGIAPEELEKIKRQVLSEFFHGRETSAQVAGDTVASEASLGDCHFGKTYVGLINAVTPDDINRVAREYLTDRNLSVVILKPKQKAPAAPAAAPVSQAGEIKKVVLSNGVTLLLRENHRLPIVSIQLAINGGMREEPVAFNGLSQLTANVWTKGTKSLSAEKIAREVESRGMGFSSFSGRNSFGLSAQLLSSDLDYAVNLLAEALKNPSFPDAEIAKEKEKMNAAILARDDEVDDKTSLTLRGLLFKNHPFALDPLGTKESVARIQRKDMVDFYQRYFSAANMAVAVYGDFAADDLVARMEKKLTGIPRQTVALSTHQIAPPTKLIEQTIHMDKEQAVVAIGFLGVDFRSPDQYGLQVMASILGSSFSGRMFTVIRDQMGLAYTLGGNFTPGRDTGLIYFQVLTKNENVDAVKTTLLKLINDLRTQGVTDQELTNMKTYIKGGFKRGIETDGGLAWTTSLDEVYGLGYARYKDFDANIDRVTAADIQRLAQKYLNPDQAVMVICRPSASKATAKPAEK